MDYEQDYIMRMIKDMVRALALVIFGKKDIRYELPEEHDRTEADDVYARILKLADKGEINEAENRLLLDLPGTTPDYAAMAADFYQHISEYSDEFLTEHNYTREEILEGLESLAGDFGISDRDIQVRY